MSPNLDVGAAHEGAVDPNDAVGAPTQHKRQLPREVNDVSASPPRRLTRRRQTAQEALFHLDVDRVLPERDSALEGGEGFGPTTHEKERLESLKREARIESRSAFGESKLGVGLFKRVDGAGFGEELCSLMTPADTGQEAARFLFFTSGDEAVGTRLNTRLKERQVDLGFSHECDQLAVIGERYDTVLGRSRNQLRQPLLECVPASHATRDSQNHLDRRTVRVR